MPTLPLNITMQGRIALVVGGGAVAARKTESLLQSGATVRLVAPLVCPELERHVRDGAVTVRRSSYVPEDMNNVFLAIAATNDRSVNAAVARDALQRGILINCVDRPEEGNCTFPAVLRRGELELSVSSGGCPTLSTQVRDMLAEMIGDGYGDVAQQLALAREKLLTEGNSSTYNMKVLRSLTKQLLAELTGRKETTP